MMSGALRWMALLSSDGKDKDGYRRGRYDERGDRERYRDERYMDDRYNDDRYREDDRRRKPYDERGGYQMRGRDMRSRGHERDDRHDREEEWEPKKLTKSGAEMWVRHMNNADGTTGEHWDYNQTEQVRQQKGYNCDPAAFYATMNMMYSDYSQVARDTGCNTVDFYAGMAKAFLSDEDAPEDKIERYAEYIAGA